MQRIESSELDVRIDEKSLTLAVRDKRTGLEWKMQEEGPGDIGIKPHAGPWTGLNFRQAGKVVWSGEGNTRRAAASLWPVSANVWGPVQHELEVAFELAGDTLDITLRAHNRPSETSVIDSYYPRGFLFPEKVQGDLVLPLGQGCLLRRDFPCTLNHTFPNYAGLGFVMPWWGQLADSGEGILAVTDTPDDIGFRVATEPGGGGHTCHPYWQASLGNFRYARRIRYRFFAKTGLVELAKGYRAHAERRGLAVTLKEKARQRPSVEQLRGSIILNVWHMSNFGKLGIGDRQKHYLTFDKGLAHVQRLARDAGIGKALVHVDGWGLDGYDSLHPDILPPNAVCGGWEGLERLAAGVKKLGFLFLLHDQYADIYADAPSFGAGNTVLDLSHVRPENCEWLGGRQQWLCPKQTMPFARRNLTEVENRLKPGATYLDCFTIGHLRECYDGEHPCSRTDAREAWTEIFRMCQGWGWATSSEGGADWAIPVLDFCWTVHPGVCPNDLKETLKGPLGDPIPLYNLVWHDCLVQPEFFEEHDKTRDKRLWAFLWTGIPSVRTKSLVWGPSDEEVAAHAPAEAAFIRSLLPLCRVSAQAGFEAMTNLELLDAGRRVIRTTYADGTAIIADFNAGTVEARLGDGTVYSEGPGHHPV